MLFDFRNGSVSYTHLEKSKADIRNMCNEMKEYGGATSELELYLLKDDELEAVVADIRTSLGCLLYTSIFQKCIHYNNLILNVYLRLQLY